MQCCRLRTNGSSASPATSGSWVSRSSRRDKRVQVGQRLVVQVHADALALALEGFRQIECAKPQSLFACPGLGLDNRRLLRLLGSPQSKEIG